jgi:hypothetical protein
MAMGSTEGLPKLREISPGTQVRLYSRPGKDLTYRLPLIVETVARLRPRSCIIDDHDLAIDHAGTAGEGRDGWRSRDTD